MTLDDLATLCCGVVVANEPDADTWLVSTKLHADIVAEVRSGAGRGRRE